MSGQRCVLTQSKPAARPRPLNAAAQLRLAACRLQEKVLGQVLVPAKHRVTCEVAAAPQERAALQRLVQLGLQPVL